MNLLSCVCAHAHSHLWISCPRTTRTTTTIWAVCSIRTWSTRRPVRSLRLPCKCWDTIQVLIQSHMPTHMFNFIVWESSQVLIKHFPLLFLSALSYNIALCYYSLKNYPQALKYISEIIERGISEHPGKSTGTS